MKSSQCFEIYKSKLTFQPDFNQSWFDKIINLIWFCYINFQQRGLVFVSQITLWVLLFQLYKECISYNLENGI